MTPILPILTVSMLAVGQLDPLTHVGSLTEQLHGPARVWVMADDTVLVTDPYQNHIARYDAGGVFLGTWAVPEGPIGVASHPDGRIFVSRRDDATVAIYDAGFVFQGILDAGGTVSWVRPTDIDIEPISGRIYVVDSEADRLYGFEADGSLALILGTRGEGNGEFKYPSAIGVDGPGNRLMVADHDNFRVQIFSTGGIFQRRFGYRMKYNPGGGQEGWMPRPQGLTVDADGHIYLADALMGTVRIFDSNGAELGKVIEYGFGVGDVRTPCDLALNSDESLLYVVSTNSSSVEIYQTPTAWPAEPPARRTTLGPEGTNDCALDRNHQLGDGPEGTRADFEGPHMVEGRIICGRCHSMDGMPGGHEGTVEGQGVLCMSCHSAGGQGLFDPMLDQDVADPYGTNPDAADGLGRSHAWGVLAVNADADSIGPTPGGQVNRYLDDDGNIKCATCHNQHSSDDGEPYLRVDNSNDQLCKECHEPRNRGLYRDDPENNRGTHPVGIAYPDDADRMVPAGDLEDVMLKEGNVECMSCHGIHNIDSGGANDGMGDGMLLRTENDFALCISCHAGAQAPDIHGSIFPQDCNVCHVVHGAGDNLNLIGEQIDTIFGTVDILFTDRSTGVGPGAFVDPDPGINGICEGCHAYPPEDINGDPLDLDPPHTDTMGRCTACHFHHNGFIQPGTGGTPPDPAYSGAQVCAACHTDMHADWSGTLHAVAFDNLPPFGQTNPGCIPCHTVGFGQETGYVDQTLTPELAGVQCENCHGTTSLHMFDTSIEANYPTIDRSAELCGSCHTDSHHPTYDEWTESGHATASGNARSGSCDACHAPVGRDPMNVKYDVECAACHNPHAQTGNAADPEEGRDYQLRYPEVVDVVPSNDIDDATNPDRFNLCGHCHHSRGRTWDYEERAPHHSVQGNVYVGEMPMPEGEEGNPLVPNTASQHAGLDLQCNTCHMYTAPHEDGPPEVDAITGHSWEPNFEACVDCHNSAEEAEMITIALGDAIQARLDAIAAALGDPATWEWASEGGPPTQANCDADPDCTYSQSDIPENVKKARFLYAYAGNDGSLGVHNKDYVLAMLDEAEALLGLPAAPGGQLPKLTEQRGNNAFQPTVATRSSIAGK